MRRFKFLFISSPYFQTLVDAYRHLERERKGVPLGPQPPTKQNLILDARHRISSWSGLKVQIHSAQISSLFTWFFTPFRWTMAPCADVQSKPDVRVYDTGITRERNRWHHAILCPTMLTNSTITSSLFHRQPIFWYRIFGYWVLLSGGGIDFPFPSPFCGMRNMPAAPSLVARWWALTF